MIAGRGVGDLSNTDLGVGGVGPGADSGAFGGSFGLARSGDDPAFRSISLKDNPAPVVLTKALVPPLKALKALLDAACEPVGVVLALAAVGVDGEPNAGCPNADTCLTAAPTALVWPKTEPGVAGTGTFGPDGCPPPNALTACDTGLGFANGESLALKLDSP